jgi:hypothetical protein
MAKGSSLFLSAVNLFSFYSSGFELWHPPRVAHELATKKHKITRKNRHCPTADRGCRRKIKTVTGARAARHSRPRTNFAAPQNETTARHLQGTCCVRACLNFQTPVRARERPREYRRWCDRIAIGSSPRGETWTSPRACPAEGSNRDFWAHAANQ